MNKFFLERLAQENIRLEVYEEKANKVTHDCITLLTIVSISKNISSLNRYMYDNESILSNKEKINCVKERIELLKITELLSRNLNSRIGYGKDSISINGIIKLIESGRYGKAYSIIYKLMWKQECHIPMQKIYKLVSVCENTKDIDLLKNTLIYSWINKNKEATSIKKCLRPSCKNKFAANLYESKFCTCGAPFEIVASTEQNYKSAYIEDILEIASTL